MPGVDGIPTVGKFVFNNIRVQDLPVLVQANEISAAKPLDGLVLSNISGTCGKGILLANMRHVELKNIHVTGFTGPLLSTVNVTGTGLAGAVALGATKEPEAIASPAQPYVLK